MDAVAILRLLWRRRLVVALGLVLAVACGIVMAYKVTPGLPPSFESRQYEVGIASAEVLVDSPSSQVADLGGGQAGIDVNGLTSRARLLANLMATSPLKDQIARRAGIAEASLITSVPTTGPALEPKPLDDKRRASHPRANKLTVTFNEELPIIAAEAQASTPQLAARISTAAVEELVAFRKTVAAADQVPDARQLVISPLGPARSATVSRGPRRLFAIVAFVFVLGLWCAGLVIVSRLARDWRRAAAEEQGGEPDRPATVHRSTAPVDPSPPDPQRAGARARAPVSKPAPVRALSDRSADLSERPERPQRRGMVA